MTWSTSPICSLMRSGRSLSALTWRSEWESPESLVSERAPAIFMAAGGVRSTACFILVPGYLLAMQRVQCEISGPLHITPSWRLRSTTGQNVQKSVAVYTSGTPNSLIAGITLAESPWKCSA